VNEPEPEQDEIHFRAKPQARARIGLLLFVVTGLAGWAILNGMRSGFDSALLITVVVLLALFGIFFTAQWLSNPRDGEIVMVLTAAAIESDRFTTVDKKFLWTDILSGRVYRYKSNQYLEVHVAATPSRPNQFSLPKGLNPCSPVFPLGLLCSSDQQKLLALVKRKTDLHL
jgi:hypothetical protein